MRLVRIAAAQYLDWGLHQDHEIEHEAPVFDVPEIVRHALFDRRGCWSRTPAAFDLRPSRQAGFNAPSEGIIADCLVKLIVVSNRVGTRANQ